MLLKEIIQRVLSAYSKGVPSDDVRLTKRHIYNKLLTTRALLLSREAKQKRKISNWNYMVLPCVEIIEVPNNEECPCLPEQGCSVYRSKYKLPRPIVSLVGHMIKSVTNIRRDVKYSEMSLNQNIYASKGSKYAKKTNRYIISNDYLYIVSSDTPISVRVEILPEDIVEAKNFKGHCSEVQDSCEENILDMEFPIDTHLIEPLIQLTYDELVTGLSRSVQDIQNNSQDNAASAVTPQRDNSQQEANEQQ